MMNVNEKNTVAREQFLRGLELGKTKIAFWVGCVAAPFVLLGIGAETGTMLLIGIVCGVLAAGYSYSQRQLCRLWTWTWWRVGEMAPTIQVEVMEPAPLELGTYGKLDTGELVKCKPVSEHPDDKLLATYAAGGCGEQDEVAEVVQAEAVLVQPLRPASRTLRGGMSGAEAAQRSNQRARRGATKPMPTTAVAGSNVLNIPVIAVIGG